jgi:hypothetical protein
MKFEIRYFFDLGSGVCLWAKNAEARERFGYPIDHWKLGISENTKRWLQYLISWFDTSLNWESPPETRWSEDDQRQFMQAATKGLEMRRAELRLPDWEFLDEV